MPNPCEQVMQSSILSLKLSYSNKPILLGKVIDIAHVETVGRRSSSMNFILGTFSEPVAGTFDDLL